MVWLPKGIQQLDSCERYTKMNDFFVILPSNACPAIHPDNVANNFHITFKDTINMDLNDNWKVALTELDFNNVYNTVNTCHGVVVTYHKTIGHEHNLSIVRKNTNLTYEMKHADLPIQALFSLDLRIVHGKYLLFESDTPFLLRIPTQEVVKTLGFSSNRVECYSVNSNLKYSYQTSIPMSEEEFNIDEIDVIFMTFHYPGSVVETILVKEQMAFDTNRQLYQFVKDMLYDRVGEITMIGEDRLHIRTTVHVDKIEFLNGLNLILGFPYTNYHVRLNKEISGQNKMQLNNGIDNMFIYCSVVAPIHVGDTLAPLIKRISLDSKNNDISRKKHIDMKNLMYVPVNQTTINSIEVNVRTDSGELVPFVAGSVTTLVLHFKKYGRSSNS